MINKKKCERIPYHDLIEFIKQMLDYLKYKDNYVNIIKKGEVNSGLDYGEGREFKFLKIADLFRGEKTYIRMAMLIHITAVEELSYSDDRIKQEKGP
jgi:hypothetical protein